MKKKACIVDIKKKSGKKYLIQPSIDFDFCNISSSCDVVSARNDERMNSDFFINIFTQELFNRIYVGKYTINMFFMLSSISLF
jgi:hypothetical protein